MKNQQKRAIMRIEVTPLAREGFYRVAEDRGVPNVSVISRITEFFAQLPQEQQFWILQRRWGDDVAEDQALMNRVLSKFARPNS